MSTSLRMCLLAAGLAASACTVQETAAPPFAGPSELALRVAMQVTPDSILQDGASQAAIHVDATGADGRPTRGLGLRLEMFVNGQPQDFGVLSAKTIVTGEDGRARVTYTAPPRPAESLGSTTVVTFAVTPIGADYRGEVPRTVDLRLVAPGIILPPNGAPTAAFSISPTTPTLMTNVVFDASESTDEGVTCGASCTYAWDFGDGATGTGVFATHQYRASGTYQVRLTVTDARGASNVRAQALTVGGGTPPTAAFTFSPGTPAISQAIFFNAEGSRAATGRTLVAYDWDFGSGRTASGVTTSKKYDTAGSYIVTLTVTDDAGSKATSSQPVVVGGSGTGPQPTLTVSPTTGTTATTFFFDASATRGPSPIVEYRFTWGDATPDVIGTSPTATHVFATAGTYVVRITVRDSAGRTATTTISVSVQ